MKIWTGTIFTCALAVMGCNQTSNPNSAQTSPSPAAGTLASQFPMLWTTAYAGTAVDPKTVSYEQFVNDVANALAKPKQHVVFATSLTYTGDLGGTNGANAKCSALGLGGNFKAILATNSCLTAGCKNGLRWFGPIYNTKGQLVADNANTFFGTNTWNGVEYSPGYKAKISFDENGFPVTGFVWTGSNNGGTAQNRNCSEWTSGDSSRIGVVGDSTATSPHAISRLDTDGSGSESCNKLGRIYCISQ